MLTYSQATVDGQTISYATEGAGIPLLLLHGLPFDHRIWAAAAPYLAGHFRLIIPDLPGFGRSRATPWDGAPDTLARLVAGLLTTTQAVPACVAGTGLGGTLGLVLAARYPERVRAVIAVGAPAIELWPATTQAQIARQLRAVPGLLSLLIRLAPQRHARRLLSDLLDGGAPQGDLVATLAATLRDPQSRQMLVRALGRLEQWRLAQRQLGGIRTPTLLIWGERDRWYGLPQAERLRHAIPGSQLATLPAAGHGLTIERPAELAALIRQYLAPLLQRRPAEPR
jgi:pimeloyl-ACP methyl ester carboxylesterase